MARNNIICRIERYVISVRIERVDDKTIKCYLSNEELEEYQIDYKDFIMRSDKAKEVVQEIIMQAEEEVGYKPPKFAFDLQIMMIPDQGLVLTFSEKDPMDFKEGEQILECLKEMKKVLQQTKEKAEGLPGGNAGAQQKPVDKQGQSESAAQGSKVLAGAEKKPKQPDFAVFAFRSLGRVMEYASVLPGNLRVKTALYVMDDVYYLHLQKGAASYARYSRACVQALEFGNLFAAEEDRLEYLKEHGECLIEEHVFKKLRTN